MLIRIEGVELPGGDVQVGLQRRGRPGELLGVVPADAPAATWEIDATPDGDDDLRGPYVQGPRGARFLYLSWVALDEAGGFAIVRRAKLWLDAVPPDVLAAAREQGVLVGRLGLTDDRGDPLCAAVRPPRITWSAAAPQP